MRILLLCSGGWSTGLLVEDMKKYASEEDVITAKGFDELDEIIDDYDVVLLGPQIGFRFNKISEKCKEKGKKVAKIDPVLYGRINGKEVYDLAKSMYKEIS